jgi:predicted phage terminase large subunit-like protein
MFLGIFKSLKSKKIFKREIGFMSDLNFSLLPWQETVFKDPTRFKVIAAGRRCGKSRLAATILIIESLKCPPGSAVLYVAPTNGQARQIVWDVLLEIGRDVIQASHINNMDITMINGAKIYVRGADRPDTLRGVSLTYAVLDEVADIKPEAWEQVIRASLSDKKGRAIFIGTPKGRNWFYDLFKMGQEESDPDWKSWHFTTQDNPLIDPTEIESAKKTLSSFAFKQEYLASFDNAGSDVFKEDWIKYGVEPEYGSYFIAIDLAGFEEVAKQAANAKKRLDESAIAVVKVTEDGKWFVKEIDHGRWDIRETAAKILMKMRDYRPISVGIERGALKNAVLPYLSDLMRKNNVYSHIVDLTHGNRKKTDRIIWSLQGRFEHGRIVLNSEEDWDDFTDQLLMFPANGVHDDLPDALSYIDQLAVTSYFEGEEDDEWEPVDIISGV